jgi:hypothetical protein
MPKLRAEAIAAESRKLAEGLSPEHKATGTMNVFSLDEAVYNGEKVYPYAPEDLIGKVYLHEENGHGEFIRAEVVRRLKQQNDDKTRHAIQFLVETGDGENKVEHIVDYVTLCDIVEAQEATVEEAPTDAIYTFKSILAHQGPLTVKDTWYKGSSWNILIEWDGGETTWEPLNLIAKSDPISVALYREENGLLNKKGWKYLKKHARNTRHVYTMVHNILKAKGSHGPKFKYGVRLPDRVKGCAILDAENGDTNWSDANRAELNLLDEFKAFQDCREFTEEKARALKAEGYQYIKLMMVYDVKHDGRY